MKYNVGDRVRIKSLDWYNENKGPFGEICLDFIIFFPSRSKYCGQIMTIKEVLRNPYNSDLIYYKMIEDAQLNDWTNEMIEGLVEDETVLNKWTGLKVELELSKSVIGVSNVESLRGERFMSGFVKAIIPPEGYQFVDENGNVISTTKIVLEKKKKEYPKTYEESVDVLGGVAIVDIITYYYGKQLKTLYKLLICRDAYWKIAGEEMGLGKPWEPDWLDDDTKKYVITSTKVFETFGGLGYINYILAFPTKEMRDAFYENFKELIEQCKELL